MRITMIAGRQRVELLPDSMQEPPLVPAQHILLEIEAVSVPPEIIINDEIAPVVRNESNTRGHVLIDRFRSTGFHKCELDGQQYLFGTSDAKLELDGVLEMLRLLGTEGLSWGHQLLFSNGASIRDPRIDYSWLRAAGREIVNVCSSIADDPVMSEVSSPELQRPKNGRIHIARTLSAVRGNPSTMLEEHPRGVFSLPGGKRYMPRMVVAEARRATHDTIANRRATRLLLLARDLALEVAKTAGMPKRHKQWLEKYAALVSQTCERFPFAELTSAAAHVVGHATPTEVHDARYRRSYDLHEALVESRGWDPSRTVSSRYAYVGYSDEIYQAFVAMLLADAFDIPLAVSSLSKDLKVPCFENERWQLYYDTAPPSADYRSWRDRSTRPAILTPDYCLISRETRSGLLGDAKYRVTRDTGELPSESLADCQFYMQHFGLRNFAVFYPGRPKTVTEVRGDGYCILEVSVTPFADVRDWMRSVVRPRIEGLLEPLQSTPPTVSAS